jgi:hypothetical protein
MSTVKQPRGARTSLAYNATDLSTLATGTYVKNTTDYDCAANEPLDVVIDVVLATTNTPVGNKQAPVFLRISMDGTSFTSGPVSGTTTTDEPDLYLLGAVPMLTATNTHSRSFNVLSALGFIPKKFQVVIKNDLGVALTSGTVFTTEISNTVV